MSNVANIRDMIKEVEKWLYVCFGPSKGEDILEQQLTPEIRDLRFYEECTELVQAGTMSRAKAHEIVDRVYDREKGEIEQEAAGVLVSFFGLLIGRKIDIVPHFMKEISRIYLRIPEIRSRQKNKAQPEGKPNEPA